VAYTKGIEKADSKVRELGRVEDSENNRLIPTGQKRMPFGFFIRVGADRWVEGGTGQRSWNRGG